MTTTTSAKPATTTSTTKAAPKASTTAAPKAGPKASSTSTSTTKASTTKATSTSTTSTTGELRKNAARNADRLPDLGSYKAGEKVATADGREWTVVGPAQGGTTLKLTRDQDGRKESVFRFARNITPVG